MLVATCNSERKGLKVGKHGRSSIAQHGLVPSAVSIKHLDLLH